MTPPPEGMASRAGALPLVGGALAFDLCNTSSGRGTARHLEHLRDGADVIAWASNAKVLTPAQAEAIRGRLESEEGFRGRMLRAVTDFRAVLVEIGEATAAGGRPPTAALGALTRASAECLGRAHLADHGGGYVWAWEAADSPIEAVLGPVALSALSILTRAEFARVKRCHGDCCGWLFLDTTKNNSRRWCEMEVCGNRAKQKRLQGRRATITPRPAP